MFDLQTLTLRRVIVAGLGSAFKRRKLLRLWFPLLAGQRLLLPPPGLALDPLARL
jgi:hypothetical protein